MLHGLLAGILWGLDTVILGIALTNSSFVSTEQAIFLAPFISTFIHDLCSSLCMFFYIGVRKQTREVINALNTKSGRYIIVAALVGGPVGMTGYVLSIKYIGASYTAIVSALFPAVGAFLSYLFLKEKMKIHQIIGLVLSIAGVIVLGYAPMGYDVNNGLIGFLFALICVLGWAAEAVIIAYGLKNSEISDEHALQIRQMTSTIFYGILLLPILRGWEMTSQIILTNIGGIIMVSALFGTASYLFYYKAINKIGASKAMALNITYCAWAIGFGFLLLQETVSIKDIICAITIMAGSIVAGGDIKEFVNVRKNNI